MNFFSRNPRKKEIPINVMVLGFQESGKTVLLTTMYHQLSVPGSSGFYLHAKDESKHNELMGTYKKIADPNDLFPEPNRGANVTEWEFLGLIKSVGTHYDPLRFTYSDYSGELAKNLRNKVYTALETQFANRLKDADVLLSILDGQKVLNLMNGGAEGDFYAQMQMMLQVMTTRDKPAHFILTKWDLLYGKYQLEEIIEQLEKFDPFRNFLASHTALAKIRLIPVSSIGMKFVQEENDGTMKKITDAQIHPFQAEMPIACILPDLIEARNKRRRQPWLVRVFHFVLSKVSFSVSIGVLAASIDHPFDNGDTTSKKLEEQKLPGIQTIRNKKDALKYVYWFFSIVVDILEFDFPASNMTRRKNVTRLKKGYLP